MKTLIEEYSTASRRLYQIANYFSANGSDGQDFAHDLSAISIRARSNIRGTSSRLPRITSHTLRAWVAATAVAAAGNNKPKAADAAASTRR